MAVEAEKSSAMIGECDQTRPLELVELNSFAAKADKLLTREELEALRGELSVLRQLGAVIQGTGGLRKFRYGAKGKGKRSGVRVIYFYGGDHMPIFLIAIYGKNEKTDLSSAQKKAASKLAAELARVYEKRRPQPPKLRVVARSR